MPPPEANDGWLAQVFYLGSLGVAGLVAWLSRYLSGRGSEPEDSERTKHIARKSSESPIPDYVVLEAAEIADMRAVRSLLPHLERVTAKLAEIYDVVRQNQSIMEDARTIVSTNQVIMQDTRRISETNNQILNVIQRIARKMDIEEEVEARRQKEKVDELLSRERKKTD